MDRQYVGIDFHRRRSVIVRLDGDGARVGLHRIVNDPSELVAVMALCGEGPGGGDRSDVRLVLGGAVAAGLGREGAFGEPGTALN